MSSPSVPHSHDSISGANSLSLVRLEILDRVATIVLDDPRSRNALGRQMCEDLCRTIDSLTRRVDVSLVILRASGPAFCAGGNIKDMQARKDIFHGDSVELAQSYRESIQQVPKALLRLPQPTLAVIEGPAIGAGFDLACFCDLRIATTAATFAESFGRLGLISGIGGAWALQRIVGLSHGRASELALTGKSFDAHEAFAWGLLNHLCAPQDIERELLALSTQILSQSRDVLLATKALLRQSWSGELEDHLQLAAALQGGLQRRPEHFERLSATEKKSTPKT